MLTLLFLNVAGDTRREDDTVNVHLYTINVLFGREYGLIFVYLGF